jgi:hypothetical protein
VSDIPPLVNADLRIKLEVDVHEGIDKLLEVLIVLNGITDLTNAEINQNPARHIKDLTREVKTVTRQTIRLTRLVVGAFDDADVGEEAPPEEVPPSEL